MDHQYWSIPLPFTEVSIPGFAIETEWDLATLLGYIGSWSAVQRYKDAYGRDPAPQLGARLRPLWGAPGAVRRLCWPLRLRVGRAD